MKVLFTTPILEHPAAGGPQLRIENSIKALNRVCELYVISRKSKAEIGGEWAEKFYEEHSKVFLYTNSARLPSFSSNRYLRKIEKILYYKFFFVSDADFIINFINNNGIDIIWFGYGNISFPIIQEIKAKRPNVKMICDTDSVWSRFVLRELPFENDKVKRDKIEREGKLKEEEEIAWTNLCEVTTAVSEIDAIYYRDLVKDKSRVKIFSNVIDVNTYTSIPEVPQNYRKPCMYLAGSFWIGSPMDKAARWILNEILPGVKEIIPNIHLYIIGKGSDIVLSDINDPNVTITGKLDSVLPYLYNADVALVPLKFESGTRFKILEAAACSIPIISTSLGAEGIPVSNMENILIADDASSFTKGVVKIIQDKEFAKRIAINCKRLIQERYSIQSLMDEANTILSYISQ